LSADQYFLLIRLFLIVYLIQQNFYKVIDMPNK
jgi:hypothetical protein